MTQQAKEFPVFSDGYEHLKVNLLDFHKSPYRTFWQWYRQTWSELEDQEFDESNEFHIKACEDVLAYRSLPTPMELINVEFQVQNLSRVCHAQLVRGRISWCYNVRSLMPTRAKHGVTIPKNILKNDKLKERALELVRLSQELYEDACDEEIAYQDARYLLPLGQQVSMVANTNIAGLFGFYARRAENGLADELNMVGRLLLRELRTKTKGILGWDKILAKYGPMGGDKQCRNFDAVFGNTGLAPSMGDEIPSLINTKNPSTLNFEKSAWYMELLELPDDLLFPGEREMIEAWKTVGFVERLKQVEGKS